MINLFIKNNGTDLSVIDDSLFNSPIKIRSLCGHENKLWSIENWLNQHPLTMIAQVSNKSIDDHALVRHCVDLKYELFGNILYLIILIIQILYYPFIKLTCYLIRDKL